jgi:hypothetical protein
MTESPKNIQFLDLACGDGERVLELSQKRGLPAKNDGIIGVDPYSKAEHPVKAGAIAYLKDLPSDQKISILNLDYLHLLSEAPDAYTVFYWTLFGLLEEKMAKNGRFYLTIPGFSVSWVMSLLRSTDFVITDFAFNEGLPHRGIKAVRDATRSILAHKNRPIRDNIHSTVEGEKYSLSAPVRLTIRRRSSELEKASEANRAKLLELFNWVRLFKGNLGNLPYEEMKKSLM